MPQTKQQKIIFGLMMAIVMVYGMEVYNAFYRNGALLLADFAIPLIELIVLVVIVILLETFIGGPLARKFAFKLVNPLTDKPIKVTLTVSILTVCCMCPLMSLVATILFKGVDGEIFSKWLQTIAINFPMAFCWQLLVAGPLVRSLFRKIFVNQI